MKTIQIDKFAGVRNDVSPERFSPNDLLTGSNIELDETGKPYRRLGTTVVDPTPIHSLWADGDICLCVRGGTLQRLLSDMTFQDYGVVITGSRVAYARVVNDIFWSDGLITGVINTGEGFRRWGIVPPPAPTVTTIPGSLRAGSYLLTLTYVRNNELESGASPAIAIHVDGTQGIEFTLPVSNDNQVDTVRAYLSDCNGEVPYLIGQYALTASVANITELPAERTLAVRTLRMGPPPPGQVVGYYKGRLYVADNNYLWYTQPYEYELVHRAMNFIGFTSPVKTFAPVSDGIFVGSEDETVFLKGDDPAQFIRQPVAPYGTVLGTEVTIPSYYFGDGKNPTPVPLWMSKEGLCAGLENGQFMNLTGGRYVLPEGVAKGASLLKIRGASPQLVTTLFS